MNLVSRLLPLNHILLGLAVSSKKRLFEQVGLLFENSRQIPRARVFDSLFDREKLGSTGLGYGVAIPHGRIKNLKEPVCAFVRTAAENRSVVQAASIPPTSPKTIGCANTPG